MQRNIEVPWQLAQVLQAIVIIMLAGRFVRGRRTAQVEPEMLIEGETTVTGEV